MRLLSATCHGVFGHGFSFSILDVTRLVVIIVWDIVLVLAKRWVRLCRCIALNYLGLIVNCTLSSVLESVGVIQVLPWYILKGCLRILAVLLLIVDSPTERLC